MRLVGNRPPTVLILFRTTDRRWPIARHEKAILCDAAAAFEKLPGPADRYFQRDGIHLREEGDRALAALLTTCIDGAAHGPALH